MHVSCAYSNKLARGGKTPRRLPEKLVSDRGPDLTSKSLEDAAFQLGIELDFNPPRTPHFKGTVESFFAGLEMWQESAAQLPPCIPSGKRGQEQYCSARWLRAMVILDARRRVPEAREATQGASARAIDPRRLSARDSGSLPGRRGREET